MIKKRDNNTQDSEYGVDSRYTSKKEQAIDATLLMEARLRRMKNISANDVMRAKLVQLKFKMEDFLKATVKDEVNYFAAFLKDYVDAVYKKRNTFSNDIAITPVRLSQIINGHRAPSEAFIKKLMVHSEKVFAAITPFSNELWYQVYFHEKLCDMMHHQNTWRPEIEKVVAVSEPILRYGEKKDKK